MADAGTTEDAHHPPPPAADDGAAGASDPEPGEAAAATTTTECADDAAAPMAAEEVAADAEVPERPPPRLIITKLVRPVILGASCTLYCRRRLTRPHCHAATATLPLPLPRARSSLLLLSRQVLENFKSYAGVKTIGPFHKCFSSVVGPNGSGKSNVIDAMLFVFGKRAKKLRLNKVSELIHSSDAFADAPLDYARVSVHFAEIVDTGDGDEDYEVLDGSESVISRVARRDNSSQYKLDGKTATFKKVAEFLGSKGIDLDNNRFLILQGEVEMISMMPPKGRTEQDEGLLEYLEDIIGSNAYVERGNEAAARVEALTEQRQERLHRVKAAAKEKDGLQGAKAEAEALVAADRAVRRKKNLLYQIHALRARREGTAAAAGRDGLREDLERQTADLAEADRRVAEIEAGTADQRREHDRVHAALAETKEAYAKYERQDIQLKENIKHERSTVQKLEGKAAAEAQKAADAEAARAEAEESLPALEERIRERQETKAEEDAKLEVVFEETREVTERLRRELEEKTQELAPLKQERTVFQNSLDTAQTEVTLLEDTVSRASDQLRKSERELASLDGKEATKREELRECEEELATGRRRVGEAEGELRELTDREAALAKKSTDLLVRKRRPRRPAPRTSCINPSHAPPSPPSVRRPRSRSPGPPSNPPRAAPASRRPSSRPPRRGAPSPAAASWAASATSPRSPRSTTSPSPPPAACSTTSSSRPRRGPRSASSSSGGTTWAARASCRWTR